MLNRQIYQQINILNDKMQLDSHIEFDFTSYLIKLEYLAENGDTKISLETLSWMLRLACYVDYRNSLFEDDENWR